MLKRLRTCPRADLLALAAITLFFFVFFAKAIFGNGYLIAGDSLFYTFPMRTVAWEMIKSGHLPLWTPQILSGYPLLSMAQLGLGYPLTWSYLVLPPQLAEKTVVLAPFLLAPVFTYAYLRKLQRSPLASLFGALTFGYGGMMASPLSNNGLVTNSVMWLPLLLICIDLSRRSRFIPTLLAATFLYSMSVLNGLAQGFLTVGVLVGLYSIWLTVFGERASTNKEPSLFLSRWRPLLVAAGAATLTVGIAAFQIMETSRVVRRSVRHALSYEVFTQGSFLPEDVWHSFTTPIFYVLDMTAYVPPLAVLLALFALCAHLNRLNGARDSRVFFWFIVAAVSYFLMMGQFTPLYRVLYYIPILNLFRVPSRHTIEWTFAVGVSAAYGWDAATPLIRKLRSSYARSDSFFLYPALVLLVAGIVVGFRWWSKAQELNFIGLPALAQSVATYKLWKAVFVLLMVAALALACLIVNSHRRSALIGCIVLVLCFVEPSLLIKRWRANYGRSAHYVETPTAATRYLLQFPPNENRIYTRVELMSEQEGEPPRFDPPNLSAIWGLQNVGGYEPLILERYSRALGGAWLDGVHTQDLGPPDPSLFTSRSHVLDLLNTKFVVSYPGLATSLRGSYVPSAPSAAWQKVYEADDTLIMRNNNSLPRAWLVSEAVAKSGEEIIAQIRGDESFDPRKTALLEINRDEMPPLTGKPLDSESSVRISAYEQSRIVLESKTSVPTVLIVSEIFFPGWEATIDGQYTRILLTDYLLRGVALPAGEHKIEMRYTAPAFRNGSIISFITIVLLVTLLIYDRRKRPQLASREPITSNLW